jgi:hypothetical protein
MLRCPVAAWEGWEGWTTKRDLHEDFERAAAGNCRAVRGSYCVNIGGVQIDEAVTRAFIAALEPIKLSAAVARRLPG